MATQEWKTVSVRLNAEEQNALRLLCEKRKVTKHRLLKELIIHELEPLLKPGALPEGEGIPLTGEHIFKYNNEEDNYTWQIDMGQFGVQPEFG